VLLLSEFKDIKVSRLSSLVNRLNET
jgi:hypothetical protein